LESGYDVGRLGALVERYMQGKAGIVEVICGPMFSGKTEELIRRLRRAQIARQKVVVFKPALDDRYALDALVSHSDVRIPSVAVEDVRGMAKHLREVWPHVDVVGIDEAQFFESELLDFVDSLADEGIRVVVAGLDQDYMGRPFGPIPEILAIADLMTKQYAVCMVCGAPASKSQRVKSSEESAAGAQIKVGAAESYEARCRRCHRKYVDNPFVVESLDGTRAY